MPEFRRINDVSSASPIKLSYRHNVTTPSEGKLKKFLIKVLSIKKRIPLAIGLSKQRTKSVLEFDSIVAITSSQGHLIKHTPNTDVISTPSQSKKSVSKDEEIHNAILASRLVDKEAVDLQIKSGRKTRSWKKLEKISNPKNKKVISDKGFSRLISDLKQKNISRNNDLKLMVLFAADNFENKKISPDQMKQYMNILVDKYTTAKAEEQMKASVFALAPTGSERQGFGGDRSLRASESVQVAELLATAGDRLAATDATDDKSSVVHNYKRDFPLSLYGWELDFGNISKTVDSKLLGLLSLQLKTRLTQEAGGQDFVDKPEFENQLVEGIHRSIDEFADSLLRSARARVDSPINTDKSVLESAEIIKGKLSKRRGQLVSILQEQLGKVFVNQTVEIPVDKIVDHKLALLVKEYESQADENYLVKGITQSEKIPSDEIVDGIGLKSIEINIKDSELPEDENVKEWAELLLSPYHEDEQKLVDKDKLTTGLAKKAIEMDIKEGMILPEGSDSKIPFVRGSSLRKAKRWKRPDVYKLPVPVTDILKEALAKQEVKANTDMVTTKMEELKTQGRVKVLINQFEKLIKDQTEAANKGGTGDSSA
ncbi:hypothetical protein [Endozoicomonas sp. SCSIO W0465]|uniref:hypothetical protein n=1 Tax=Endozoicomonas sp. SCSIO W0465 TaxID=2918516 RepID=UPI00207502F5|nr:hypothetical protein [Endozoicomonas sp. SCSIO W0465]USE36430.1 hypothetical protein MJO57_31185 [Endozoicomonas sp. SCSIO W0465]